MTGFGVDVEKFRLLFNKELGGHSQKINDFGKCFPKLALV